MGPKFNDKCPYRRERERQRRRACEDGGKDWSYACEARESWRHPAWEEVQKDSPCVGGGTEGFSPSHEREDGTKVPWISDIWL